MHECSVVNKKIAQERAECVSSSPHKIPLGVIEHKLLDFVAGIFGRKQDERYCLTSSPMKCGVSQCPCLLVIIPVELLLGHYRGIISQNSACRDAMAFIGFLMTCAWRKWVEFTPVSLCFRPRRAKSFWTVSWATSQFMQTGPKRR